MQRAVEIICAEVFILDHSVPPDLCSPAGAGHHRTWRCRLETEGCLHLTCYSAATVPLQRFSVDATDTDGRGSPVGRGNPWPPEAGALSTLGVRLAWGGGFFTSPPYSDTTSCGKASLSGPHNSQLVQRVGQTQPSSNHPVKVSASGYPPAPTGMWCVSSTLLQMKSSGEREEG